MTPDLRKIAETLRNNPGSFWDAEFIFPLLDALVEEKAMRIKAEFYQFDYGSLGKTDECYRWTDNDWRTQALRELGLEGLWPMKGG